MTAKSVEHHSQQHDNSDRGTVRGPHKLAVGGASRLTMTRALSLERGATRSLGLSSLCRLYTPSHTLHPVAWKPAPSLGRGQSAAATN